MNKKNILLLFILIINLIGCVTTQDSYFNPYSTKESLQEAWHRKPDRVYTKPSKLKYGADEVWEWDYPGGGDVDRYYFKEGKIIKKEHIVYGDL